MPSLRAPTRYACQRWVTKVDYINLAYQGGTPPETEGTAGGDADPTADHGPLNDPNDLMHSIEGMYRILDLISETGSGGLGAAHISVSIRRPNHMQQWKRSSSTKNR